ncbi:predicted protein [Botrytis cinerea T4]|uniref:Uncharacterized protein n=1 Tax=Botryotinia fuckeliana (strain T4) TaxID=999810 RepID=G2XSP5_BOTF4|nr:predicted protein [Botrytis cinerea T4]
MSKNSNIDKADEAWYCQFWDIEVQYVCCLKFANASITSGGKLKAQKHVKLFSRLPHDDLPRARSTGLKLSSE